jgi:hypothetical protein
MYTDRRSHERNALLRQLGDLVLGKEKGRRTKREEDLNSERTSLVGTMISCVRGTVVE